MDFVVTQMNVIARPEIYIQGVWRDGQGEAFQSIDPSNGSTIFESASATVSDVDRAVNSAIDAFSDWALTPLNERIEIVSRFRDIIQRDSEKLARIISRTTGKPLWETKTEAAAVAGKVDISIKAHGERTGEKETATGVTRGMLRHKPHGVLGVLGPFNFPAHLPNGHIIPALIAGNSVVFKPSELAPEPGVFIVEAMAAAGVPPGVVNLVHGARETGEALAMHDGLDGLLFTGGARTGAALHRAFADRPEKILALELGGNNPLIWWDTDDVEAAAFAVAQSAFLTSGQRCTCARRLIIPSGEPGERAIEALTALTETLIMDEPFADPQPFHGPVISADAATKLVSAFDQYIALGGKPIKNIALAQEGSAFVSPAIIDMTDASNIPDEEHFGPLLQVYRVPEFESAIELANATKFGLSAGLLSDDEEKWNRFFAASRAGVVNWNRQTTGASGAAPFGGIGHSGNHRPSAYYAADYCAYPVASMEADALLAKPTDQIGVKTA